MKTRMVRLGEVCDRVDYGHTASADFAINEPRFLRITDIQEGRVNWGQVPGCQTKVEEENQVRLQVGDIVFARTGATTGKSFLIRDTPRAVFASYLIRLRASRGVIPEYLAHFFQSDAYWRQVSGAVRGAAQPALDRCCFGGPERAGGVPRRGSVLQPRVVPRPGQPWAGRHNAVGVGAMVAAPWL
jgi:type I restriction enzyme S subunit